MKAKKFGMYLLIAILYFILAFPFAQLSFGGGYSQIRFTNLISMPAGLLFGFPGALACALGNLAADICTGFDSYCIFGFFGNLLMAWLPYKMWHSMFFFKEHSLAYLESLGSVIKLVCISVVVSCASIGVIAAGGQLLGGFSFAGFFLPVALQYYDFSLLGGMLVFQICLTIFHIKPQIPKAAYRQNYKKRYFLVDYILSACIVILSGVLSVIATGAEVRSTPLITGLCVGLLIFTAALALLPMTRGRRTKEHADMDISPPAVGIGAQFVTFFLSILGIVLVIFCISILRILYADFVYMAGGEGDVSVLWLRVITLIAIAGTFLIITLPLLLKIIQRKIINPVLAVSKYARKFASGDRLEEDRLVIEPVGNELDDLSESVNIMVDDLKSYVEDIRRRTEKEEKLAAELSVARNIQRGLLPGNWTGTGFDIVPYIKPAKEVGGDFYHFSTLDEDRVFICIADVSGKDISAAMFMVETKTLIEANCMLPPEQMLARVNDILSKTNPAMMFVTAFAAVVDRKNRRMTYASAGHNPPICRNAGEVKWLDGEADFVLGPMEGMQYRRYTMEIADDFELFIYTDGVNEAENQAKEFYGNDRLFKQINTAMNENTSCRELIKTMEQSLEAFTEGAEPSDDITMLALAVK